MGIERFDVVFTRLGDGRFFLSSGGKTDRTRVVKFRCGKVFFGPLCEEDLLPLTEETLAVLEEREKILFSVEAPEDTVFTIDSLDYEPGMIYLNDGCRDVLNPAYCGNIFDEIFFTLNGRRHYIGDLFFNRVPVMPDYANSDKKRCRYYDLFTSWIMCDFPSEETNTLTIHAGRLGKILFQKVCLKRDKKKVYGFL